MLYSTDITSMMSNMYSFSFVFVCVLFACSAAIDPTTDEACNAISGKCQNVSQPCYEAGKRYYGMLCRGRSRYCCAKKTDESACKAQGGTCDYYCIGAKHFPEYKCEGHMKCCIALI